MLTTLTLVKMLPGLSREDFYARWQEHTRDKDLRDHPEISLNRLMMFDEGAEYVGMAENHWPDRASLDAAIRWYETPEGKAHQADLESFMDTAHSPTMIVSHERTAQIRVAAASLELRRSGKGKVCWVLTSRSSVKRPRSKAWGRRSSPS